VRTVRLTALVTCAAVALIAVSSAAAVPPTLVSVGSENRHPTATFGAPKSDHVVIQIATKADRATNGEFLNENVKVFDVLEDSEVQTGSWKYEYQLDPGSYYVLLRASPDFGLCYRDDGTYDPSCADGYSQLVPLTIPKPAVSYRASTVVRSYAHSVSLRLHAAPLGEKQAYKVCYRTAFKKQRCLAGVLDGFSWSSAADDELTVSTRGLAATTTFTWTVGGKKVAVKRVHVAR